MAVAKTVKFEGDNSVFVWKHPCEEFDCNTQLIVHEGQEVLFLMNGQALDLFGPGRYELEGENIPKIKGFFNKLFGKEPTRFNCEAYFINKTVQMAIKWGTDSKIRFLDPQLGIPLELGACGEINLSVEDSQKLVVKLVGTAQGISWEAGGEGFSKSLQSSFRPLITTAVKTHFSSAIKYNSIDILEIDEHLEELSETLRERIAPGFEEYGLTVPQLYITNVALPEDDPNFKKVRELHTLSLRKRMISADAELKTAQADADAVVNIANRKAVLEAEDTKTEIARKEAERELLRAQVAAQSVKMAGLAEAEVMNAKGYNQKDLIDADIQTKALESIGHIAANGDSGIASDLIGLGVGVAVAGTIAPQLNDVFKGSASSTQVATSSKCSKCGAILSADAKFCRECGEKVMPQIPEGSVVCPGCGNIVSRGKFCAECGYKFISACPQCGKEVPVGAKFCAECGTKL